MIKLKMQQMMIMGIKKEMMMIKFQMLNLEIYQKKLMSQVNLNKIKADIEGDIVKH